MRDWRATGFRRLRSLRFRDDLFGEIDARGNEDGQCLGIVLCLGDQVAGDLVRVAALAGDDDLRGAGEHVDGTIEGHEPLGGGDVEIARPDDLVYTRKRRGSVSQCGYSVRATEAIELGDTEEVRCGESLRRGFGRNHCDALDACNLRGNGRHQQC